MHWNPNSLLLFVYIITTLLSLLFLLLFLSLLFILPFWGNLFNVCYPVTAECFRNSICRVFHLHNTMAKGTILMNFGVAPPTQDSTISFNRLPAELLLLLLSRVGAPVDMADLVCNFPGKKKPKECKARFWGYHFSDLVCRETSQTIGSAGMSCWAQGWEHLNLASLLTQRCYERRTWA